MEIAIAPSKQENGQGFKPLSNNYEIIEGVDYDIVIDPKTKEEERIIDRFRSSKISKLIQFQQHPPLEGEALRFSFNFLNYVGRAKILGYRPTVISNKLSSDDTREMISKISNRVSNLPFDYNLPTYQPFEMTKSLPKEVLYHSFTYLRSMMQKPKNDPEKISNCVFSVLLSMKRELRRKTVDTDIAQARIDSNSIKDIFTSPHNLVEISDPRSNIYNLKLARRFKSSTGQRYIPSRTTRVRVENIVDIPENRFFKYFLQKCRDILYQIDELTDEEIDDFIDPDFRIDLDEMLEEFSYYLSFPILREVNPMESITVASSTLKKRSGYREIFRHYSKLNLASEFPMINDLISIIENKDIAKLYEYWCFFELESAVEKNIGKPFVAKNLIETSSKGVRLRTGKKGLQIEWRIGDDTCSLLYEFSYAKSAEAYSYSKSLRPDFTFRFNGDLYLFDAKFKQVKIDNYLDEKDEKEEDIAYTFKNGDLYKMHTYRDAIRGAKTSVILYPGSEEEFRFYEAPLEHVPLSTLNERRTPDNITNTSGVGAIPLKPPSIGRGKLIQFVGKILESGA
jgi:hypothetical protein